MGVGGGDEASDSEGRGEQHGLDMKISQGVREKERRRAAHDNVSI